MKSEKGITLISTTIYVIALASVIGIMAIISRFFYNDMKQTNQDISPMTEYTRFNSFFSDEINRVGIKVLDCGITENGQNYIVFDNNVQYTYIQENKGIYRNKVKIARNVTNCVFTENKKNNKDVVEVIFEIDDMIKQNTYTLKK